MENMIAFASQLTDESTEASEIDVAHIYLQAVRVEPKSGECTILIPMHLHFIQILSRAHHLPLPITILYLMSGYGRSCRKFKKICTKKNEVTIEERKDAKIN